MSFFAPVPGFAEKGLLKGKSHAEELFSHHQGVTRTEWFLQSAWTNGREVLFESRIEGVIEGKEHAVQVVMAFVVRDGLVVQFREYASYMSPDGRSWNSKSAARDTFAYRG